MMVGRTVVILGWGLLLSFLHCKELGNHHLILTSTLNTQKINKSSWIHRRGEDTGYKVGRRQMQRVMTY